MKIKQRRRRREITEYQILYQWKGQQGGFSGFSFPCDKDGEVDVMGMNPAKRQNYLDCSTGVLAVECIGVREEKNSWVEPGIGICDDCGEEVTLQGFTCTCRKCGADYNSAGQRLAPRSQWGWETGETAADILAVDHTPLDDFDF